MATQIFKSIKTGGDYATWQAACAAIPLDLVAADENWIFEFENTGEFATPGTHMYLSSGGTSQRTIVADATRTVTFRPKAGHGFRDHANKLINPLRYDVANGVGIVAGGGSSTDGVFVDIPYAVVEGLQIYGREDSVSVVWPTAVGSEVRSCLISAFNAPQFPVRVSGGAKLLNSIVVCTGTSIPWGTVAMHGPGQVIGCTLANIANNSAGTSGIFNNYGTGAGITLKDNVVVGVTDFVRDYNGLSGAAMWSGGTYSNNAFTGSIPIGSANVENIVAGDQFVNIASSATLDLRPKAGNSLQAGVTDALLGGVDILGQTRAGTPTIGAMEYVAGGGGVSVTVDGVTLTGAGVFVPGEAGVLPDPVADGVVLTGAGTFIPGAVSVGATASFTTQVMKNNVASIMANTAVLWEWRQGTGIGVAPTSVTYGTGTTTAGGVLVVPGLPAGAGDLFVATADYANVFFERGTAA